MIAPGSLLSIIAHARSGALEHAWAMFQGAGLERVDDDASVLSVHGRLLKDRAVAANGAERRRLYAKAAGAYARAAEIGGALYPLINAATLSLLGGKPARARALARQVLDRDGRGEDEPDTPYWRGATRAEALLLLGQIAKARQELKDAIALAPQAYEDHASTLRQFALILTELGKERGWLREFRPPRCVHFAGHMAIDANDKVLAKQIRDAIAEERAGFGYGALAAGADILIAEALLDAGAELRLILPATQERFRAASVAQFGRSWATRFDRVLKAAVEVRAIDIAADPASPLAFRLAAEMAMGAAVLKAETLQTEAIQLLILDGRPIMLPAQKHADWIASHWKRSGRRQHILLAPRIRSGASRAQSRTDTCLAAALRIAFARDLTDAAQLDLARRLARILAASGKPLMAPRWMEGAVVTAFATPPAAARAALSVRSALTEREDLRMASHYTIVERVKDPFGGKPLLIGPAMSLTRDILLSTPSGAIHVTEDFAEALYAGPARDRPGSEFIGELPSPNATRAVGLFSLRA